jgi:hypothetical protein
LSSNISSCWIVHECASGLVRVANMAFIAP